MKLKILIIINLISLSLILAFKLFKLYKRKVNSKNLNKKDKEIELKSFKIERPAENSQSSGFFLTRFLKNRGTQPIINEGNSTSQILTSTPNAVKVSIPSSLTNSILTKRNRAKKTRDVDKESSREYSDSVFPHHLYRPDGSRISE